MKEAFKKAVMTASGRETVTIVNGILAEYESQGYDLSLRQLYYQMVARGYIENSQRSYKRIGDIVNEARLQGLVDWDMIKDRGRETVSPATWRNPGDIIAAAVENFAIDKWQAQPNHVEVMVEKQALEGVLIPVCESLNISFSANKGYSSSSTMHETGKRLARIARSGKRVYVLYLGDHDPSGIDMTRDVAERLGLFSGVSIHVQRLALNYDQIEDLQPPENPAKATDSRYTSYAAEFGESSWELDAIEPGALANLVTEAVMTLRDEALWTAAVSREDAMRAELQAFAENYSDQS